MTSVVSRRAFLGSALAAGLVSTAACAGAPQASLRPVARGEDIRLRGLTSVDELIDGAGLGGSVGFAVLDAASGRLLEDHQGQRGQPPASVAKALTSAYALDTLGPDFRFATEVLATGPVTDGMVAGDLVLNGGGDPTLDTDGLAALAAQLKAAGLRGITGRFLVCGGALPYARAIDPDQPEHVGYNPAVSALNLNYNRVHFEWRRGGDGYQVSMDAPSATRRPAVRMARMGLVARDAPLYTYADGGGFDDWTVARGALGSGGARWLPVRKPELYAGEVLQALAAEQGLRLPAPQVIATPPAGTALARHSSAPLSVVLRDMLKFSTNLTAEVVGMWTTRARLGRAVGLRESAGQMNGWAKARLGLGDVALVDHSGLGPQSRISAQDMAQALLQVNQRLPLKPMMKPFPLLDSRGRPIPNSPLTVQAKTGTLNFVSGLAGFVDTRDGRQMVFAIFCADLPRRDALSRAEMERPEGGAAWNRRAKGLQQDLIERWAVLYGS